MNETNSSEAVTHWRWALSALLVVLWVFLIVGGYFWGHQPLDVSLLKGIGLTALSIVFWLATSWLAAAFGRLLLGKALAAEQPLTGLTLATSSGLGLISLLLLFLALLGLFNHRAVGLLILGLVVLSRKELRNVLRDLRSVGRPAAETGMQRRIAFFCAASLALTFVLTLAPPVAWDSLAYHLTGARFMVESGRIVHPVDIPHLGFPLLGQMQFALGMLFVGDGAAALFHFGYGLMTLALTVALTRRLFGRDSAWYAAAILLSIPSLHTLLSWPYVDGTLLFYATMALYGFVRWRDAYLAGERETGWLLLIGLACGFSGSVKYTAVIIPFSVALSMAWTVRREGLVALARRLTPIALVAVLLVVPYLVENWLTTGNPVYPFFFDDGLYWDSWRAWWYDRPGTGLATTAPWRLPLVPLEVTIIGAQGSEAYDATVGPLLLLSLGLLPFVWRTLDAEERVLARHMLLFIGLNYVLWLNGVARTALLLRARFLFFIFGIVAVVGSVALARLDALKRPALDVPWIARTLVALSLGFVLFSSVVDFLRINPVHVIMGLESRESYQARRLGPYVAAMEAVNELPDSAKVEFLWESRSYPCQVECWPDMILDRFLHYTQHYGFSAAELRDHWLAEGYTHILLHDQGLQFVVERGLDPIGAQDLAIIDELSGRYLQPVAEVGDVYTLFAILPSD